jgi:hypothetical protein
MRSISDTLLGLFQKLEAFWSYGRDKTSGIVTVTELWGAPEATGIMVDGRGANAVDSRIFGLDSGAHVQSMADVRFSSLKGYDIGSR